jgi:hypothetical protein
VIANLVFMAKPSFVVLLIPMSRLMHKACDLKAAAADADPTSGDFQGITYYRMDLACLMRSV